MTNADFQRILDAYYNEHRTTTEYWNAGYIETGLTASDWGLTNAGCSGSCTSNQFGNAKQCYGFALFLAYLITGTKIYYSEIEAAIDGENVRNGWVVHKSNLTSLTLEPGDIIRTGTSPSSGHSAMVRLVNSDGTIKVAECLGRGKCKLEWEDFDIGLVESTSEYLLSHARYILKAPKDTEPAPSLDDTYKISNVGAAKCLNIHGSSLTSLSNGINVTLWSDSGSNEQKWVISDLGNNVYVRSIIDTDFGLNVYRSGSPYNCNIRLIEGNETDAAVDISNYGDYYKIKLHNYNYYLTVGGTSNGTNVYWASESDSDYQKWTFTEL